MIFKATNRDRQWREYVARLERENAELRQQLADATSSTRVLRAENIELREAAETAAIDEGWSVVTDSGRVIASGLSENDAWHAAKRAFWADRSERVLSICNGEVGFDSRVVGGVGWAAR